MTHLLERTGPSAVTDVVDPPAAARPEPELDKGAETVANVVVSQTRREEDLGDTVAAGVTGGREKEGGHSRLRAASRRRWRWPRLPKSFSFKLPNR